MFASTRQFDYNNTSRTFVAEISSLGDGFKFDRIYPDACDGGFTMVSHVTGRHVEFVIDREDSGPDGEVHGWHLIPTPEYVRTFPNVKDLTVTIWND